MITPLPRNVVLKTFSGGFKYFKCTHVSPGHIDLILTWWKLLQEIWTRIKLPPPPLCESRLHLVWQLGCQAIPKRCLYVSGGKRKIAKLQISNSPLDWKSGVALYLGCCSLFVVCMPLSVGPLVSWSVGWSVGWGIWGLEDVGSFGIFWVWNTFLTPW